MSLKKIQLMSLFLSLLLSGGTISAGETLRVFTCGQAEVSLTRPVCFWPPGKTEPQGYEPDLIRAVAKRLNMPIRYVQFHQIKYPGKPEKLDPRLYAVKQGYADVSIMTLTITDKRKNVVDFTIPHFDDGQALVVRANSKIKTTADLAGKRILAEPLTTGFDWVKQNLTGSIIVSKMPRHPLDLVASNEADAYIGDRIWLSFMVARRPNLRILPGYAVKEQWGMAVKKGNDELRIRINNALNNLKTNGELKRLKEKWLN